MQVMTQEGRPQAPPQISVAAAAPGLKLPLRLAPDRSLMVYYALFSLLFGPGFVIAIVPLYFRFRTLRYELDEEGITMRWGILFRREISLTYARIQDIHLSSNVVERWLGLAKIQVQTASGNASAELTIQGLKEFESIRDFLYSRMRGATDRPAAAAVEEAGVVVPAETLRELVETLGTVAVEVRAMRAALGRGEGDHAS
jgi:uncharacterized membrane protein YdbT with pleckstrin-like domain